MDTRTAVDRLRARIPERWGPDIACEPGWYELLAAVEAEITAVEEALGVGPIEVLQVKQKFATLRVYWEFPEIAPPCCETFVAQDPAPSRDVFGFNNEETRAASKAWHERLAAHQNTDEHRAAAALLAAEPRMANRTAARNRIDAAIDAAEAASSRTCEICGNPGTLRTTPGGWHMTRCQSCD